MGRFAIAIRAQFATPSLATSSLVARRSNRGPAGYFAHTVTLSARPRPAPKRIRARTSLGSVPEL